MAFLDDFWTFRSWNTSTIHHNSSDGQERPPGIPEVYTAEPQALDVVWIAIVLFIGCVVLLVAFFYLCRRYKQWKKPKRKRNPSDLETDLETVLTATATGTPPRRRSTYFPVSSSPDPEDSEFGEKVVDVNDPLEDLQMESHRPAHSLSRARTDQTSSSEEPTPPLKRQNVYVDVHSMVDGQVVSRGTLQHPQSPATSPASLSSSPSSDHVAITISESPSVFYQASSFSPSTQMSSRRRKTWKSELEDESSPRR